MTPGPTAIRTPDGRSLETWLAGPRAGTALVFHFGTPGSGLPFEPMVAAAAERGLRWVSWSRPGYGGSTRRPGRSVADVGEDAATVLDRIGAERAYVVGWSGGGPHALACAALLPERVLGTATIAGVAPYPAEGLDWLAGMGTENVDEFTRALQGPEALAEFMAAAWPIFRDVDARQIADAFGDLVDDVDRGSLTGAFASFVATLTRTGLRDAAWGWLDDDLAFTRPWGFDLATIRGPVHVWQGAHDRMVPFAHGQWLASHVGGGCAHLHVEEGHLSLLLGRFPAILDSLIDDT